MGQQQNLLLALGVIIVLSAISVGTYFVMDFMIGSNKDAIVVDLNSIASDALGYAARPEALGGGDGTYDGYEIPRQLTANDNASYSLAGTVGHGNGKGGGHNKGKGTSKGMLTLVGISTHGYGTVTMTIDDSANVKTINFTGKFQ